MMSCLLLPAKPFPSSSLTTLVSCGSIHSAMVHVAAAKVSFRSRCTCMLLGSLPLMLLLLWQAHPVCLVVPNVPKQQTHSNGHLQASNQKEASYQDQCCPSRQITARQFFSWKHSFALYVVDPFPITNLAE
ncbi:unknown protein [Seminavis robusta]|uniref:Uncharacterized protein n=1 Tax=Seminavis robusta TaxID=568900 RepID=A0A9N8E7G5_9STRA|nr:unknown protein [Seminavis robusta]|eukprot:Sro594_g172481.1  (131) ;mRNA; r:33538-33930